MPAGEGVWSYLHPSLPSFLSQAVSRDCLGFCQQLAFSDPKPGLAPLPANKLMPLKDAAFSPGPGTSGPDIWYCLWPCSAHGMEDSGPGTPLAPLLGLKLGVGAPQEMFQEPAVEYSESS